MTGPPIRYLPVNAYNMRRLSAIEATGDTLPGCTSCKTALLEAFVRAGWIEGAIGEGWTTTAEGRRLVEEWRNLTPPFGDAKP